MRAERAWREAAPRGEGSEWAPAVVGVRMWGVWVVRVRRDDGELRPWNYIYAYITGFVAVYVYVLPWSEFSIVPSHPHYSQGGRGEGSEWAPAVVGVTGVSRSKETAPPPRTTKGP